MTHFNGPELLITQDAPTAGVLNLSVEENMYSEWKEWVIGRYFFNTETDVNGTTERITYTDHSLHTGQAVNYSNEFGSESIGLVTGTTYYVRADDGTGDRNTFELYDTKVNAEGGPATTGRMDLTASGVGNGEQHRITADNAKFAAAFRTIGGDELTPGVEAGGYFFLQNQDIPASSPNPARDGWRIISTEEDQTLNYSGNLVGEDSNEQLIVPTVGYTVLHLGLQPVTQRVDEILEISRFAEYSGGVWIDTFNGSTGTSYPIGTQASPVNNLANARTIANSLDFEIFYLRGSITLTDPLTDWRVVGYGAEVDNVVAFAGQNLSGSVFENVSVSGTIDTLTRDVDFTKCRVGAVTDYRGTITACGLEDDILLAAGQSNIVNCYSAAPGAQVVNFDYQAGNAIDLFIRGMIGVFSISNNSNAASIASVDLLSGEMTIDADFLNGSISVRGTGTYNNDSALAINDVGLIDQKDVRLIKQMTSGNATVSVDDLSVTVYDEDMVTVLATFSLSADGRIRTRLT